MVFTRRSGVETSQFVIMSDSQFDFVSHYLKAVQKILRGNSITYMVE